MQATIEAARRLASDLVASASRRFADVRLRFALVEYRDTQNPRFGFKARTVTELHRRRGVPRLVESDQRGDEGRWQRRRIGPRRRGPGAPASGTRRPSGAHVDWPTGRAGELATKLLVLLGDAPDHAQGSRPGRGAGGSERRRRASRSRRSRSTGREASRRDEQARYRDQWRTLAERSSYRPLDKATGFVESGRADHGDACRKGTGSPSVSSRSSTTGSSTPGRSRRSRRRRPKGGWATYVNSQGLDPRSRRAGARRPPPRRRREGRPARPSVRRPQGPLGPSRVGRRVDRGQADGDGRDPDVERRRAGDPDRRADPAPAGGLGGLTPDLFGPVRDRQGRRVGRDLVPRGRSGGRGPSRNTSGASKELPPPRPGSLLARSQKDLLRR